MRFTLSEIQKWAEALAKSGSYDGADARTLLPRIVLGAALGIDPATAASNITISKGRTAFSAALQAALLDRSERFDCRVISVTDEAVELEFLDGGKPAGTSTFTLAEARRAGLLNKSVWQAYPSDLLFARAFTRGVRRYARGLLLGNPALVLEELGANVAERILSSSNGAGSPSVLVPQPTSATSTAPATAAAAKATTEQLRQLRELKADLSIPQSAWKSALRRRGVETAVDLTQAQADQLIQALRAKQTMCEVQAALDAGRGGNGELTVTVPALAGGKEAGAAGPTPKSD
jgi:hypothetical protein